MERFAFARVLRMPRAEFLRGSRLAAIATHDAMHTALHSEDGAGTEALARLADDGCLASPLHQELMREIQRGRAASTACLSAGRQHLPEPAADAEPAAESVLRLMRAKLAEQASEVAHGEATLTDIRLVAGMHRSLAEASGGLAGHHRLHVGSHLLVVDDQPDGLWRVERQRQLLLSRGCCVQLEVEFGGRDAVRPASSGLGPAPGYFPGGLTRRHRFLFDAAMHVYTVHTVRTTVCMHICTGTAAALPLRGRSRWRCPNDADGGSRGGAWRGRCGSERAGSERGRSERGGGWRSLLGRCVRDCFLWQLKCEKVDDRCTGEYLVNIG